VTVGGEAGEQTLPITPLRAGATSGVLTSAESIAEAIGSVLSDEPAVTRLRVVVTGEALPGDLVDPADPVGEAPIQRTIALAGTSASERAAAVERDTLSVVLSTTGAASDRGFGLTSPAAAFTAERRDAHRRTRRGKQQRRRTRTGEVLVQARLFKM
ncbi:MAG: hypothetical protein M3680_35260, partial [Myxococcota bacterium]|nr:hypothetical protein [Myxococcota bacterium]